MLITIKSEKTNKEAEIYIPATEKNLQQFCKRLGIENNMKEKVSIISIEYDDRADKLLKNQAVNLDELNFLIKRIDSLSTEDLDSLYAVAYTEKTTSVKDLINLSYNTDCYDIITVFDSLEAIGRRMYQNNELKAVLNDFKASDFEDYAEMVLKNQIPAVTPYGLIYRNENKQVNEYDGKVYPVLTDRDCLVMINITKDHSAIEHLYLPTEKSEIEKTLERIDCSNLEDLSYSFITSTLPENTANFIMDQYVGINELNNILKTLKPIDNSYINNIDFLIKNIDIRTTKEFETIISTVQEFEIYKDVTNTEEYGKYMIKDSGRFEYDENLEEYIDFKRYGNEKCMRELGFFTKDGYIIYYGFNQDMQNILCKNLNIKFGQSANLQEIRLYMP